MADPLFEIGNHAWEHRNLRLLEGRSLINEIEYAQTAYEQVRENLAKKQCLARDEQSLAHDLAAERQSLFQFPFGACDNKSLEAVSEYGLKAIQWDVSSGDPWIGQKADLMVKAVVDNVKPGSIVLFHANGRGWHTGSALPEIIRRLRDKGYKFLTVSELLKAGEPVYSEHGCYDSRPHDTDRYDALAARLNLVYDSARRKALEDSATLRRDPAPNSVPIPTPAERPPLKTEPHREPQKSP